MIEEIYRKFIRDKVESGGRRAGLHVSDLVSDCLRKSWYRMSGLPVIHGDDSVTNFYYGTTVHESFDGMFEIMENKMCVNPYAEITEEEMVDIDKEMKDNPFKWVSGSFDALYNGDTILDFKTAKKLPTSPSMSYIKQINFYSYMYYLQTGVEIKKGCIFYLDKSTAFHNVREFHFDLLTLEENRGHMIAAMDEIAGEEPPEKVPGILCTVCPYKDNCDPHGYYDYKLKRFIN